MPQMVARSWAPLCSWLWPFTDYAYPFEIEIIDEEELGACLEGAYSHSQ
jgi:hypothetical protein